MKPPLIQAQAANPYDIYPNPVMPNPQPRPETQDSKA